MDWSVLIQDITWEDKAQMQWPSKPSWCKKLCGYPLLCHSLVALELRDENITIQISLMNQDIFQVYCIDVTINTIL